MDPIELQIQQEQPTVPPISVPSPTVPEPNVPNPVSQTIGGLRNILESAVIFGRPFFKPRATFINYAANKAFGSKGAAILNTGLGILPFVAPMIKRALRPNPQQQGIGAYINQVYGTTPTGQISSGPMAGYNAISAFGSPGAINSAIKRIGTIAKARSRKESETLKQRQKDLQNYVSDVQKQMTIQKGGMGADRIRQREKQQAQQRRDAQRAMRSNQAYSDGGGNGGGASPGSQGPGGSDEMGSF